MEENKNQILHPDKNNKSINFNLNNHTIHSLNLGDSDDNNKINITNLKYNINIENNEDNSNNIGNNKYLYTSPKKPNIFFRSGRNKSFHTPNYIFNTIKNAQNDIRKNSMNIDISQNNNLSPNKNNKSIYLQNNELQLKRIVTAKNTTTINDRPSAFLIKNKRFSNSKLNYHINFRNSKNFNLENNKFKNFFKNEGDRKLVTTSNILTERNKEDTPIYKNISRRNSIIKSINKDFNRRNSVNKGLNSNIIKIKNFRRMKTLSFGKYTKKSIISTHLKKMPKKEAKPIIVNPLLISEEDKIFDEMKKYLCFKYDQRRLNNKSNEVKKAINKSKISPSKIKKNKIKIQTTDQIKLDYLYLSTTKMNKKIRHIKKHKDRQDLAEYQNTLLDAIKPTISDYTYTHLKDKLINIRIKNSKKYSYNYKKIKEIETEEEGVINDFNRVCKKCLRTFQRARKQKEVVHSNNLKIKLPLLNFISCLKKKKKQIKRKL